MTDKIEAGLGVAWICCLVIIGMWAETGDPLSGMKVIAGTLAVIFCFGVTICALSAIGKVWPWE